MATPTPITAFTPVFKPLTQITPFTFRDGYTFLEMYSELRQYLVKLLGPEIDAKLTLIYTETQAMVNALAEDVNASKVAWQELFDEFMANVIVELEGLNDQAIVNLIKKKYSQFSVVDFGAVGDGSTDDTASIQAALDACYENGGGVVFVPFSPMQYRVSKLYIRSNTTLKSADGVQFGRIGVSFGVTNLRPNNGLEFFTPGDKFSSHGNIIIDGGIWDGRIVSEFYYPTGYNHFYFACARNIEITNCTVKDIVTNHAVDINAIDGGLIHHNNFLGYFDATPDKSRGYAEAVQVGGFNETETVPGSESGAGAPSQNIHVYNNVSGESGTLGTQSWPVLCGNHGAFVAQTGVRQTNNIHIYGNTVNNPRYAAFTPYTWDDVTIRNNVVNGGVAGVIFRNFTNGKRWNGVSWDSNAPLRLKSAGIKIVDNEFNDITGFTMNLTGTGVSGVDGSWAPIENVVVERNMRTRSTVRATGSFIRILLAKSVRVAGNISKGTTGGITVESSQDVSVIGNMIDDATGYGIAVNSSNGVGELFPLKNVVCSQNQSLNSGSHGIGIIGYSGVEVVGNFIYNPGRVSSPSTCLMINACDGGLVSGNIITIDSLSSNLGSGVGLYSALNINVTLDNVVNGMSPQITGISGGTNNYGNVVYSNNIGWTDISLASGVVAYNADSTPQYRVIMGVLYLRGAVKGVPENPANFVIGSIPSNYSLEKSLPLLAGTEGVDQVRWFVYPGGDITISNNSNTITGVETWYPLPHVGMPNKNS